MKVSALKILLLGKPEDIVSCLKALIEFWLFGAWLNPKTEANQKNLFMTQTF